MSQDRSTRDTSQQPAATSTLATSSEAIEPSTNKRDIKLKLVASEADTECRFWVSLVTEGLMSPQSLMDIEPTSELIKAVARDGLSEEAPLMLSDTSVSPPRHIYLLPLPSPESQQQTDWVQKLIETLQSWEPQSVGFYLAPELINGFEAQDLLRQILHALIHNTNTNEFCLLVGSHGLNWVLNAALKLKNEFENETTTLQVFH